MPRLDQLHGHEAQAVPRVRLDSAMCRVDCAADRDEDGTGAPVAVVAECVEVTELERVAGSGGRLLPVHHLGAGRERVPRQRGRGARSQPQHAVHKMHDWSPQAVGEGVAVHRAVGAAERAGCDHHGSTSAGQVVGRARSGPQLERLRVHLGSRHVHHHGLTSLSRSTQVLGHLGQPLRQRQHAHHTGSAGVLCDVQRVWVGLHPVHAAWPTMRIWPLRVGECKQLRAERRLWHDGEQEGRVGV